MILETVSATQIVAFRLCKRRWYNRYILKHPEPKTPAQERGTGCHKITEKVLLSGPKILDTLPETQYEWGQIVAAGLSHLPKGIQKPELVERKFTFATFPGGPLMVGYIDHHDPESRPIRVLDHKTISDFRRCKTPKELQEDTQMSLYARWAMEEYKQDEAEVGHLYLRTKKPYKSFPVWALMNKALVQKCWDRDMAFVKEMMHWAKEAPPTAEPLEPNTQACSMFPPDGCPYRARCGLQPGLKDLGGKKMSEKKSMSEILAERKAGKSSPMLVGKAGQAHAKATGTELPTNAGFAGTGDKGKESFSGEGPCGKKLPGGRVCGVDNVWCSDECMDAATEEKKPAVGVVPPDAPPRDEQQAEETTPAETPTAKKKGKRVGAKTAEAVELPSASTAPEMGAVQLDLSATDDTLRVKRGTKPKGGLVIYVDCMPVKGGEAEPTLFEDYIRPFFDRIAEAHGLPDAKLMDFARWKPVLANAVRERITDVPPVLVVSSYGAGVNEALEVLIPVASKVVRALRG